MQTTRTLFTGLAAAALVVSVAGTASAACPAPPTTPCTSSSCKGNLTVGGYKVPYWRNYALGTRNTAVERAIIVIHGLSRNVTSTFDSMVDAAALAETEGVDACAETSTIILAPKFQSQGNSTGNDAPASNELRWLRSGWVQGDQALAPSPFVSSFDVVDHIIGKLKSSYRFPNLEEIIVVGHSAGGQFTNRYAAGSADADNLPSRLRIRFVVTNPSSYLYFDTKRPVPADPDSFVSPYIKIGSSWLQHPSFAGMAYCPTTFNDYKYGLEQLNPYMSQSSLPMLMVGRYMNHDVTYFIGEDDDFDNGNMATGCAAMFQGPHRLARALSYHAYMTLRWPSAHDLVSVPGVAHSGRGMYTSDEGLELLFD